MSVTSLKIIIFMWQCGLVDTFTVVNFLYNAGAQYSSIVIAAMADGNVTKLPGMLFEPIAGFGVSYQFVKAAQTAAERRVALNNQDVKNEYERIKKRLEEGINPVDIGRKSTPVASNKVLIKGDEGRYLVEVSGGQVKVLGMCARGNKKNVNSFKTLMNEMYDVDLKY